MRTINGLDLDSLNLSDNYALFRSQLMLMKITRSFVVMCIVGLLTPCNKLNAQPDSRAEDSNCGGPNASPMSFEYMTLLPQAIIKLADEARNNWSHRQRRRFEYGNYGQNSWEATFVKIMGELTQFIDGNDACMMTTIHYRGGCRETSTTNTELNCYDCIFNLGHQLVQKCPHSKTANGFAFDCFVRYQDQPFLSVREVVEWPSHPLPMLNRK